MNAAPQPFFGEVLHSLLRRPRRAQPHRRSMRPMYLGMVVAGLLGVLCLQILVMAVDPYNMYSWSPARTIPEESQSTPLSMYLLRVAARADYDTAVIGGSTVLGLRPRDLEQLLPGAGRAVNVAYPATLPGDMTVVFREMLKAPDLRQAVVALDYVYLLPPALKLEAFPYNLYKSGLLRRFLAGDGNALWLTARLLLGQSLMVPGTRYSDFETRARRIYRRKHSPGGVEEVKSMLERGRSALAAPGQFSCKDFPSLDQLLVPFAREMSRRGNTVDILIPPYYFGFYYLMIQLPEIGGLKPTLDSHIAMRRCAVEALAGLPHVRVFAFDGDAWLVEDQANFYDESHIVGEENYRYLLTEMAAGRHQLTPANFEAYASDLRKRVLAYQFYSSGAKEADR